MKAKMIRPGNSSKRPRSVRVRRALLLLSILLVFGMLGGYWLVTRSWFIVARAESTLSELLGGRVTLDRAAYLGEGRFELFGLRMIAERGATAGSEIAAIDRSEVQMDARALRFGRAIPLSVRLHGLTLRISEHDEIPGEFNLGALRIRPRGDDHAGGLPPEIEVVSGVIEFGSHGRAGDRLRGRRTVHGALRPHRKDLGRVDFQLEVERPEEAVASRTPSLQIDGVWHLDRRRLDIGLSEVDLDEPLRDIAPAAMRAWWEYLELDGRVSSAALSWSAEAGIGGSIAVRDAGITMPIQTEAFWQWYRMGRIERQGGRPRMLVRSGRLDVSAESLSLTDLEGRFVARQGDEIAAEIPYFVTLHLTSLPPFTWASRMQWADDVARTAAFNLHFRAEGVEVRAEPGREPPAVILPTAVVDAMQRFRLSEWTLSTTVDVQRDSSGSVSDPQRPIDQIVVRGQAMVRRARGAYADFPYDMHDVSATLEFTHERVVIHELRGRGSDQAVVRLSGEVELADQSPGLRLHLRATDLPLDERLRAALTEPQQAIFDAAMHKPSLQRLKSGGLIDDEAFQLGGRVDLDMIMQRAPGEEGDPVAAGRLSFSRLGLLHEAAPYPVTLRQGVVELSGDRVRLLGADGSHGIAMQTAGGGRGMIRGEAEILPGDDAAQPFRFIPQVELIVEADPITDRLLAALPADMGTIFDAIDVPDALAGVSIAELLTDVSLQGVLQYRAELLADEEGGVSLRARMRLDDGELRPDRLLSDLLDRPFSEAWRVEGLSAEIEWTSEQVTLIGAQARIMETMVEARGARRHSDGAIDLRVRADDLRFTEQWLDVLEPASRRDAERLLRTHAPEAAGAVNIEWRRSPTGQTLRATMTPTQLSFLLGRERLDLECSPDSQITIEAGSAGVPLRVEVPRFRVHLGSGTLTARGTIDWGEMIDAQFGVDAEGELAGEDIVSSLPDNIARAVRSLQIREGEASRLVDGYVRGVYYPGESRWSIRVEGSLHLQETSMEVGFDLEEVVGVLDFIVAGHSGGQPSLQIAVALERARALNQLVRDARFALILDESGRSLHLRDLTGRIGSGMLTAHADIGLYRGERHDIEVRIFGAPSEGWRLRDEAPLVRPEEDDVEGSAYAHVVMTSIRGDETSRVGRGLVRLVGGRVAAIPFGLQLVQVLQLSFPVQRMEHAQADFFIVGSRVHVENMLLESVSGDAAVQHLIGSGLIDLEAETLNLRFRSRGSMLLLRDVLGELGDRVAVVHLVGPWSDPRAVLIPLPAAEERSTAPVLAPPRRVPGD